MTNHWHFSPCSSALVGSPQHKICLQFTSLGDGILSGAWGSIRAGNCIRPTKVLRGQSINLTQMFLCLNGNHVSILVSTIFFFTWKTPVFTKRLMHLSSQQGHFAPGIWNPLRRVSLVRSGISSLPLSRGLYVLPHLSHPQVGSQKWGQIMAFESSFLKLFADLSPSAGK